MPETNHALSDIHRALRAGETVTLMTNGIDARKNLGKMPSVAAGQTGYMILTPAYGRTGGWPTDVEVTTIVPDRHAPFDFAPGELARTTIGQAGLKVTETGISLFDSGATAPGLKPPFHLRDIPLLDADISVIDVEIGRGALHTAATSARNAIDARERSELRAVRGERTFTGFER